MHAPRVGEDAVEVAPGVALVGPAGAPARAHRLRRVRLQEPVGHVDDVDVLLDDDVAGERLVVDPVAHAPLDRGRVRPVGPVDRGGEVVDLPADGRPDLPRVDAPRELDVGRGVADLEADREAELLRPRDLAEGHDLLAAGHVHPHRLLEVDVLARGERGLGVQRVEPGRARDVDRVHVLAGEEGLVGPQPLPGVAGGDRGLAGGGRRLVEPLLPGLEVVGEEVRDRGDDGARVLDEAARDAEPAPPAAEQAEADGRVRLRAEDEARLEDGDAGGGRGHPDELAAADPGVLRVAHGSLLENETGAILVPPRRAVSTRGA